MTPRDFCYWLQGFFEISEAALISGTQHRIIKNHLALVHAHASVEPFAPSLPGQEFCQWLQAGFDKFEGQSLSREHVAGIRTRLNSEFQHYIDPTFGDKAQLARLKAIHDGGEDSGIVMMC